MKKSELKQLIKEEIQKVLNGESSNNIWDSYQMIIFDVLPSRETAKKLILQALETPRSNERYWYESSINDAADMISQPSRLLRKEDYPYLYINPDNNGLWRGNENPNYKKTLSLYPSIKSIKFSEINNI